MLLLNIEPLDSYTNQCNGFKTIPSRHRSKRKGCFRKKQLINRFQGLGHDSGSGPEIMNKLYDTWSSQNL